MSWKMTRTQQIGVIGVALVLLLPPIPSKVSTEFVLEPGKEARVRVQAEGIVKQVLVHQGDSVKAGQLLAVLQNAETEADASELTQQLALASSHLRGDVGQSDLDKAARSSRDRTRLQEEFEVAQKRVDALEIRAPFAGVVTTPEVEQRVGEFLAAGSELCHLADRTTMKARILVRDWELEEITPGAAAQVKVLPFPFRTYSGRVERILPAAALDRPVKSPEKLERLGQELTNYFAVVMDFPNPDGSLKEGMTGTAKISVKGYPLAWRAARASWHWVRSYVWW